MTFSRKKFDLFLKQRSKAVKLYAEQINVYWIILWPQDVDEDMFDSMYNGMHGNFYFHEKKRKSW